MIFSPPVDKATPPPVKSNPGSATDFICFKNTNQLLCKIVSNCNNRFPKIPKAIKLTYRQTALLYIRLLNKVTKITTLKKLHQCILKCQQGR